MKKICILGSTGSIGTQTLDVVRNLNHIKVLGLTTNQNIELLEKQISEFQPKKVAVMDLERGYALRKKLADTDVEVLVGMDGITEIAVMDGAETIVNSVVGSIGLRPTMAAIETGKDIALANKETLVTAGKLFMKAIKENHVNLYPIDSEHSAIFQCLQGNEANPIHKIYLTASGGPFRTKDRNELENVTIADALAHPNWSMGPKITIDSATMMNKGLEVIEAKWLFDVRLEQISVLVHPQSVIHSMVEFEDSAVMAQLGEPDMRVPIQYALAYPKRVKNNFDKINFLKHRQLTFEEPDLLKFPCLQLAFDAISTGGTMPVVLNGANETAVEKFLAGKITFLQIPQLIERTMKAYTVIQDYTLDDVFAADQWARDFSNDMSK